MIIPFVLSLMMVLKKYYLNIVFFDTNEPIKKKEIEKLLFELNMVLKKRWIKLSQTEQILK